LASYFCEYVLPAGMRVWVVYTRTRTRHTRWVYDFPNNIPTGRKFIPYPPLYRVIPVGYSGFGYPLLSLVVVIYTGGAGTPNPYLWQQRKRKKVRTSWCIILFSQNNCISSWLKIKILEFNQIIIKIVIFMMCNKYPYH
jgi:hypothetical protein